MKKLMSLIKACMTDNMNLFKVKTKNKSSASKKIMPIFIAFCFMAAMWTYANILMESLIEQHAEFALLPLFILFAVILTLIEGIYKAGNLMFNCKDDDLLLSLPIKKSTVLFIRVFKFYVFELLYNTIILFPAMLVYARYVSVDATFFVSSLVALLVIPIVPIVISCIIGGITSMFSAKFKMKNIAQIVFTTIALLGILYLSFNLEGILVNIAENASSIKDMITKLYYPAGAYYGLITEFNILDLLIYIGVHIALFVLMIFTLSRVYFKINSKTKVVRIGIATNKEYKVKTRTTMKSLIKKELNRFTTSPVFIINAGFGLVLFLIGCILFVVKFDSFPEMIPEMEVAMSIEQLKSYAVLVLFGLICFASLMSSITCSMISLEGKTFNILKSLPLTPFTIIVSKVLTAVLVMVPVILLGDIIFFIKFGFNIIEIMFILIASVVLPLTAETIGILSNLSYPKMDAENDTEVVKQSTSTFIATLLGMVLSVVSIIALVGGVSSGLNVDILLEIGVAIYTAICIILLLVLKKTGTKKFNKINV